MRIWFRFILISLQLSMLFVTKYRVCQKEDGISDVLHNTIQMFAGFRFRWKTSYGLMSIKTSFGNISLKNSDIFQSVLD